MRGIRRWASVLASTALPAAAAAGCAPEETAVAPAPGFPRDAILAMPPPHTAPPTTPLGPIYLDDLSTIDGSTTFTLGKCLGFTLIANDEGILFSTETVVTVGPLGEQDTLLLDGARLRVGSQRNGYRCTWTEPFGTPGPWDVVVRDGERAWTIAHALEARPTRIIEIGRVTGERVWSGEATGEPGANVFEVPYDADVYLADFWLPDETAHLFAHFDFFPTGTAALLPTMEFREPSHPGILTARGGLGLVFPKRGMNYLVVRDEYGLGGPGATYDVSFVSQVASAAPWSERCRDAATITARTWYLNYDRLSPDFDPAGAPGCRDSVYGTPIHAPGNDAVWRIRVPSHTQLRVATYDDHIDNTTYLLPVSVLGSGSNGCPARPTNCAAAAGRFGGGNTDTLVYDNPSDADRELFLVHDSATVMTNDVGSFLMDIQLFER